MQALFAALILLGAITVAKAGEVPVKVDEVPVKSRSEIELYVARAALKGDFAGVLKHYPEFAGSSSEDKFIPLMAYASWKAGDSALALKLLEGRTDELSAYVLRMVNPSAVIPGAKAGVKEAQPFFIKTTYKSGSLSLGVLPKSVENIALQRAFYAIMPEPTVKEMGFFKDKVLAFPEAYFLGGEVLSEDDGEVIYMVFVGRRQGARRRRRFQARDTDARRRSYEEGFGLEQKGIHPRDRRPRLRRGRPGKRGIFTPSAKRPAWWPS